MLWQAHLASAGDVVLVCTLGFTILHGSRDLAVALVDMVQHVARVSEALATLLLPHETAGPRGRPLPARIRAAKWRSTTSPSPIPTAGRCCATSRSPSRRARGSASSAARARANRPLLALLQRLRVPQQGRVLVDGEDIAELTQQSLTEAIAVVPQDVMLFHRSVMDNIRYGRPDADDEEVRAAAEAAGCREFIEALPQGWDTPVGDRGVKLSGGQRQRLAIARAFLRNAPMLVLDEATSALDTESEAAVQRRAGPADAGPHGDRGRAPAVDAARLRPHRGDAERPHRAGRRAWTNWSFAPGRIASCCGARGSG